MSFEMSEELKKKLARIGEMAEMSLVYGIVDEDRTTDDVLVWEYAIYMEYGTTDKDDKTIILARPFFRSFIWNKHKILDKMCRRLFSACADGKMSPLATYKRLGRYMRDGILNSLETGEWQPNAEGTVKIKKSSKPLVDTGTLMKCIGFVIYKGNEEIYREVVGSAR